MKVLIACEFSGIVREAFRKKGHDVWSCDLLPTEIQGQHIQGDVIGHLRDVGMGYYDLIIHHSSCTFTANSGVRWLYDAYGNKNHDRWEDLALAITFFNVFNQYADKVCGENPIPHKYAKYGFRYYNDLNDKFIGRHRGIGQYSQIIQPWQFGHGETKATCLWLRRLPKLKPTNIVKGREHRIWKMPPGPNRQKERSRTFLGIADAMDEQWG